MDMNARLKRIVAMLLAVILVLLTAPAGTANESSENHTIYSEWWRPNPKTVTAYYTFSGIGDTVLLPYLLGLSGIYGTITEAETDSNAVELDESLYLTAVSYFDSVELTVTVDDRTYVFILHNPGEEPGISAGTEVTGDDGSFIATGAVPAGTRLVVGAFEPTENLRAAVPAEDEDAITVWMDIGLLAPDGEAVHTGADVYVKTQIELPAAPEADGLTGHAVLRDARLYHVTGEGEMEELPVKVETEEGYITALRFSTESFSGFALSYTVDFTYEGRAWSFPGQGSYRLADVLAVLGIEGSIDDAALTLIQGEDHAGALYLTQSDGEYCINSEIAFADTYELRVRIGEKIYIITVTDDSLESANLSDFLKNVVITGATQDSEGNYHVESGKEYSIILTFAEDSSHQFADTQTLTYQMPAGITILSPKEGNANINIVYKGRTYQIGYHYKLQTNGKLEITFDTNDPDFPKLQDSTNVSFRFTYNGEFSGQPTHIEFSDVIERVIFFDEPEPGQAYAEKTATYDETTGTFHYTITVTATGDAVRNVNVKDIVTGDALNVDVNSITISGNSTDPSGGSTGNGFDYTFPSMQKDEVISITYDAHVNFNADTDGDGKITVDQTKNSVTVKPEGGDPHSSEYSREINYMTTSKSAGTDGGTTENGDKILNWTIDYNPLALVSAAGNTVTDRIGTLSQDKMKYYGTGITVEVRDRSGDLVTTRNIGYSRLTYYDDTTWTYTIPEEDTTPYHYTIKYQTVVDMTKVNGAPVSVDNYANDQHNSAIVIPTEQINVTKIAESFDTTEVNWVATLSVPAGGLNQAVVYDDVPVLSKQIDGQYVNFYDFYKDGTLQIYGLLTGEDYVVTFDKDGVLGRVQIEFFQDQEHRVPGLQRSENRREITVSLKTSVNQEWLQIGYNNNNNSDKVHTNTIYFNGIAATAQVVYDKPWIKKTGTIKDNRQIEYTITLSGVSEVPVSIQDTFDRSLLEMVTTNLTITGGDQWYQGNYPTPISYTDTPNGFGLTANTLPKDPANGQYYPYYRIVYTMKLKDDVDLEQLAIANGGEHHLVNTAKWGDHESEFDYTTTYDYLDKELLNAGELGETNRKAQYRITFNSAKATLHSGEPMEMTDIISANLSVDYSSIQIVTDPAGQAVPYSLSGGKDENGNPDGTTVATYTVPDSTKVVITYDADVRGNGSQTIVNKVSVNGQEETIETIKSYGSLSEGEGAIASFKIVKVDGYDANKKLKGVTFKIFAENPDIYFNAERTIKEILLTTDENGEIVLDGGGGQYLFYFDECYHVQEVEPLPDYGTISFDYLVTLTNNMALVDYGHYIYYYNDSMQIKNWPLEGLVVEKQVESTDDADKEKYYRFRVSILNDDGTVNTAYNEKNGDDQFVSGSFEFELKDKEQKMFWGFNKGTKYKVEEIDSKGLAVSVTYKVFDEDGNVTDTIIDQSASHTGTLTQQNEIITFKNSSEIPTAVDIPVIKILRGRDMEEGEFAFVLQPIDINGNRNETAKQITYNPAGLANQEVTFNFTLEYSAEDIADAPYKDNDGNGVYFYVVYEQWGDDTNILYSDQQYIVKVTLSQDANGHPVATPQYYLYDGEGELPDGATDDLDLPQPLVMLA